MKLTTEFELPPSSPTPSRSPREQVMQMIQGYWVSQICGTTARLALVDQLHDGPRTVSELASLTSTDRTGWAGCCEPAPQSVSSPSSRTSASG